MVVPYRIYCPVKSLSHHITPEAFTLLTKGKTNITVDEIHDTSFSIVSINDTEEVKSLNHFVTVGHLCISCFLMSLNVASVGCFIWVKHPKHTFPLYTVFDPTRNQLSEITAAYSPLKFPCELTELTEPDVRRAALMYGALARERQDHVREEYIKGLYHLSLNMYNIDFHKDAFSNFYRSFEYLATDRILKVEKLKNELKQFKSVIKSIGLDDDAQEEFNYLYKVRSEQIMHAQREQKQINIDDVFKMKTFLDAVLFAVYKPVWEKNLTERPTNET